MIAMLRSLYFAKTSLPTWPGAVEIGHPSISLYEIVSTPSGLSAYSWRPLPRTIPTPGLKSVIFSICSLQFFFFSYYVSADVLTLLSESSDVLPDSSVDAPYDDRPKAKINNNNNDVIIADLLLIPALLPISFSLSSVMVWSPFCRYSIRIAAGMKEKRRRRKDSNHDIPKRSTRLRLPL